jgi:hypothetical protein
MPYILPQTLDDTMYKTYHGLTVAGKKNLARPLPSGSAVGSNTTGVSHKVCLSSYADECYHSLMVCLKCQFKSQWDRNVGRH